MSLRPQVAADLRRHGIEPEPGDEPARLRERLNDAYLEDVRHLRERQRSGAIPLAEYAAHVEALRGLYPALSLPLELWGE